MNVTDRVCYAIEYFWSRSNTYDEWDWIRTILHGAGLAQIPNSQEESDFYLLRDIAAEYSMEARRAKQVH